MKKKNSKKRGRKALKIIGIILCVLFGINLITIPTIAILNHVTVKAEKNLAMSFAPVENPDVILPQKDADGNWYFETDRPLKILQLTDIHIGGGCFSTKKDTMALNAVASMVTAEKPDLIIVTGDLTFPVPFFAGTLNNLKSAEIIATLFETLGVSWVPIYGNHDTEAYSYHNREEISNYYKSDALKHCLFTDSADVDGFGNSTIQVQNTDGLITHSLFLLDSHSYTDDDKFGALWHYDNIHQNQIDWYKESLTAFNATNKATFLENNPTASDEDYTPISSLLFIHIPSVEYEYAWNEFKENGYRDTENVQFHYGAVGESEGKVCHPIEDDLFFETVQEMDGKKGIFCGHDHLNTFSVDYKDVRLTYGFSIDYLAYSGISKVGSQRGCTVITLDTDSSFDCVGENYYQDKYVMRSNTPKETVTMQDLNENQNN